MFKYVLERLQNDKGPQAVQLQALLLAEHIEYDETNSGIEMSYEGVGSDENDVDMLELDYVEPFLIGGQEINSDERSES